jgi:hypothetical protein
MRFSLFSSHASARGLTHPNFVTTNSIKSIESFLICHIKDL